MDYLESEFYFEQTVCYNKNLKGNILYSDPKLSDDVSMSIGRCAVVEIMARQIMDSGCVRARLLYSASHRNN